MDLRRRLARAFIEEHPLEAAAVLETLAAEETVDALKTHSPVVSAAVVRWMSPAGGTGVLEDLDSDQAAAVIGNLPIGIAAAALRRLGTTRRDALLASLAGDHREALQSLLRFPPGTAGALMEPRITVLVVDQSVADAISHIHRSSDPTLYNLYVIDRERNLVGVLNLDELLSASPRTPVARIMRPVSTRLSPTATRHQIVSHPGWQQMSELPVVDAQGCLLGAIRHGTLRELETALDRSGEATDASTTGALGDLFSAGLGGIMDAIALAVAPPDTPRHSRGE